MLLIENAYLIDPASKQEKKTDILIRDGIIVRIEPHLGETLDVSLQENLTVIDAAGLVAAPGLVDVHSHFRDPGFTYKEDIFTGAKAAAKGGYTTVVLMANTRPCVDNEETLSYVNRKGKETGIHIYTCATVTMGMQGKEIVPMEELAGKGAVGFTDDGVPLLSAEIAEEAMRRAKNLNMPISFHEENPAYIKNNGINAGKASEYYKIGGSPREAEIDLVRRDLQIALRTGAEIDIQHISTKEAVELVREAKKKGSNIHAEATPHHFTLTEDAVITYGSLAKMNPPLREESDRRAIIEGLKDGTIDMIATDHAPHSSEEKEKLLTEAPSGIIGLETALPLSITELVETGEMTLMSVLERLTTGPASLYHLQAGYVKEGGPADLVLFDPQKEYTIEEFVSKSKNSPFLGRKVRGEVYFTICAGKIVYEKTKE
ncbi:MAG: dihydroorotase [Lachnospiraceae bacterium]